MKTERIDYIDNAKGLLIILVVFAHFIEPIIKPFWGETLLLKTIYAFHMPAFFCITGILQNYSNSYKQPFHKILTRKVKSLLIPYTCFEAFGFAVRSIMWGPQANFNGFVYNIITLKFWNDVDWFLITLFFADITFILIRRVKETLLAPAGIISFLLALIVASIALSRILIAFAFIVFGYYCVSVFTIKQPMPYAAIAVLITIMAAHLNPVRVDINCGIYGNAFLFATGAISGTFASLQLSREAKCLSLAGRKSLYIMGIHTPLLEILRSII